MCAYENYTIVLGDHLLKKDTIDNETRPKVFKTLTKNQLNKDEFDILTKIILKGSPQLGRDERDLASYVNEFIIQDGQDRANFCIELKQ